MHKLLTGLLICMPLVAAAVAEPQLAQPEVTGVDYFNAENKVVITARCENGRQVSITAKYDEVKRDVDTAAEKAAHAIEKACQAGQR